jgi:hypothetical protein
MINLIRVNDRWLPEPDGDLRVVATKVKSENETEAGTTQVIVTRVAKLTIEGSWKLTGEWMERFRSYRNADTVTVELYYPSASMLSAYTCQFDVTGETHNSRARQQLGGVNGLYEVEVTITEI